MGRTINELFQNGSLVSNYGSCICSAGLCAIGSASVGQGVSLGICLGVLNESVSCLGRSVFDQIGPALSDEEDFHAHLLRRGMGCAISGGVTYQLLNALGIPFTIVNGLSILGAGSALCCAGSVLGSDGVCGGAYSSNPVRLPLSVSSQVSYSKVVLDSLGPPSESMNR